MSGRMEYIMTIAKLDHPYKLTAARAAWTAWQTAKTRAEYTAKGYYTDAQRAAAAADAEAKRAAYHDACADLRAIIDRAEGHAKVRCMTVADIMHAIDGVPGVIKKKHLPGCQIVAYDPSAQTFPGAYKYVPESTQCSIVCRPSGWYLTAIGRDRCTSSRGRLVLTDGAKADIIAAAETL